MASKSQTATAKSTSRVLTQVKAGDSRWGNEVAWIAFAKPEKERIQPPVNTLREMFLHLWTRLDEVHTISNGLSHSKGPITDAMRRNLQSLATIANVENCYVTMNRLLAEAEASESSYAESLRVRLNELVVENEALRAAAVNS